MIKTLLAYQFVFLLAPALIISMAVFGSDFKGPTGWVHVVAWSIISILHILRRWWAAKVSAGIMRILLIIAIPIGVLAYRQIHLDIWDEHNLSQAILISLLAVLAYLGSVFATLADDGSESGHFSDKYQLEMVLIIFSVCWLVALMYPQIAFFAVVLILGLAAIWLSWSRRVQARASSIDDKFTILDKTQDTKYWGIRYLVFVLYLDAGLVVWDYKVNLVWAGHLAVVLLAAALGVLFSRFLSGRQLADHKRQLFWVYMLVGINMAVAMSIPTYVISTVHTFLLGLGLGVVIAHLSASKQGQPALLHITALWPFVVLGLVVGYAFYAQLSLAAWRILFVIPLLIIAVKIILKTRAAVQSPS
ncbi:MAG: hypothetical protein ACC707_00235 [Thiohalomonadales bacterium]